MEFLLGMEMKTWDDLNSAGDGERAGEVPFVVALCPCGVSVGHANENVG